MPDMDDGRIQTGATTAPVVPEETTIDRIRRRAHEMWEAEGRPDGRDREHWERAKAEILGSK